MGPNTFCQRKGCLDGIVQDLPLQAVVDNWLSPPTPTTFVIVLNLMARDSTVPPQNLVTDKRLEISTLKQYAGALAKWADECVLGGAYLSIQVQYPIVEGGGDDIVYTAESLREGGYVTKVDTLGNLKARVIDALEAYPSLGEESSNHMFGCTMQQDMPVVVDAIITETLSSPPPQVTTHWSRCSPHYLYTI